MLSLLSLKREITGIDYDKEKIDTANNSLLMRDSAGEIKGNIRFIHADIMEYELPQADIFMLNDMLHYLSPENQRTLIENCIAKLNCGGKIIIRDGDTNKKERHKMTALSEKFSTEIIRFNKNESGLHFLSSDIIVQIASRYGLEIESIENDSVTSNTIYLLSNPRTSQVCGS
ncbi:MAG: class I SAM-dependent methyltransferase [Bacteroidales bacterium]|nr:class I SAM-dependent methyltransferase [Bacteroidales bacterium]